MQVNCLRGLELNVLREKADHSFKNGVTFDWLLRGSGCVTLNIPSDNLTLQ